MSMKTYPFKDIGFYINSEVAAYIMLAVDQAKDVVPEEITELLADGTFIIRAREGTLPCEYSDSWNAFDYVDDFAIHVGEFDGEVNTLIPERAKFPIEETLSDEFLAYVPAAKEPDLFKAAYETPDALLGEFVTLFAEHGITFPKEFDWWGHIVSIFGTIFC